MTTEHFVYADYTGSQLRIQVDGNAIEAGAYGDFVPSTNAFRLGGDLANNNFTDGHLQHWCGGDGNLSAANIAWLYNAGAGRHRGELDTGGDSVSASQCKFWWPLNEVSGQRRDQIGTNHLTDNATVTSAAGLVEGPAVNNSPVSTWQDQSGNGNDAVAGATHSTKPIYKTGQINGQPAVDFDGTLNHHLLLTGMTVASGDYTFCAALNQDNALSGTTEYIFDTATGRLIVSNLHHTVDEVAYYDAVGWVDSAASTDVAQVLTWVLKAADSGAIYRDGAAIATGQAYTQRAIGGAIALAAQSDGAAQYYFGLLSEFTVYSSALAASPLAQLHNYMAKYGTI